jgi:hypothetical protein
MNYIPKISEIEDHRCQSIFDILKINPKVLSATDYIKINRCVSYMTFMLKEKWEFFSLKTSDGVYIFKLRKILQEKNKLEEKLVILRNMKNMKI